MSWEPSFDRQRGPAYLGLAEAIATDVRSGSLPAGTRLPTQRELARRLGITPGTVARGYLEAERRGLIEGQVGRGTFVRSIETEPGAAIRVELERSDFDLSLNHPPAGADSAVAQAFSRGLAEIASGPDVAALLALQPARGSKDHRAAAARWLSHRLPGTVADDVLVCSGGQHAIAVALAAACRPGDLLLCERLTYAGLIPLARELGVELLGLDQDEYGLLPSAVEAACAQRRPRALYCIPTLQNPTTAVMPTARRRELVELAERHDLTLIEDDVYGTLHGEVDPERPGASPPPLAHLAPDRTLYVSNAGKSLAPGLRIGFLRAPSRLIGELEQRIQDNCWSVAPLMVELISRWIDDGTAHELVELRRQEAGRRTELARRWLGDYALACQSRGFHLWLALPDPWTAGDFVAEAAARGLRIAPTSAFAVGNGALPRRVRLALGREANEDDLERALERVAELLASPR